MNGVVPTTTANWTTGSVSFTVSSSMQFSHKLISFGTFTPPASAGPSTLLLMKIMRSGSTSALDTYDTNKTGGTVAANLGILYADLHYQKKSAGSVEEY